jgi:hypothetical protein
MRYLGKNRNFSNTLAIVYGSEFMLQCVLLFPSNENEFLWYPPLLSKSRLCCHIGMPIVYQKKEKPN